MRDFNGRTWGETANVNHKRGRKCCFLIIYNERFRFLPRQRVRKEPLSTSVNPAWPLKTPSWPTATTTTGQSESGGRDVKLGIHVGVDLKAPLGGGRSD